MTLTRGIIFIFLLGIWCPSAAWAQFAPEVMGEVRGYVDGELPLSPVFSRLRELGGDQDQPIVSRMRRDNSGTLVAVGGGLSGKTVYLSPGHGWVHTDTLGWSTQRDNTHGLVEDLSNIDGVSQFLVSYLLRAGAQVVGVRELDPNPEWVILDNSDGAGDAVRGTYSETGDSARFSDSALAAWGHPELLLGGTVTPFALGQDRLIRASTAETARATFVPNVPRSGHYNLYVSYTMDSTRASDAQLVVTHPGGTVTYLVDQRRHGGTWVLVDRLYFEAGTNWSRGAVAWSNQSQDPEATISVDAIRLGGGSGVMDRGGGTSQQPRADECARYHTQLAGAPATVFDPSTGSDRIDDVASRSRFADWLHAPGESAVYLSYHSNAWDGTLRGTETYVYGTNEPNGSYQPSDKTLELKSDRLGLAIQEQLVSDLRGGYQSDWKDRGLKSAYFGELNTANQDEMAAALVEVAFHDNEEDATALKEPAWRRLVARAMYKGIVKFFADGDKTPGHLLPEPPREVMAINSGPGRVTISWVPPPSGGVFGDPAQDYRVYRSVTGAAFDDGVDTLGKTSLIITDAPQGEILYLRVSATNPGGESLPSATLAVGVGGRARASVLLVDGFDRLDGEMNVKEQPPGLGEVERLYVERMNSGTYLVQNGQAVGSTGFPFDACLYTALESGGLEATRYAAVVWAGGRGLKGRRALSPALRETLTHAAQSGVALFISSAVFGRWMDGAASPAADRAFFTDVLSTTYAGPAQPFTEVIRTTADPLAGLAPWSLTDGADGSYDGRDTDGLQPVQATQIATYLPSGAGAMTLHASGESCSVLMGFPLEAVRPSARQGELLARLFTACAVEELPDPDGGVVADAAVDGSKSVTKDSGPHLSGEGDTPPAGCGCRLSSDRGPAFYWWLVLLWAPLRRRRRLSVTRR